MAYTQEYLEQLARIEDLLRSDPEAMETVKRQIQKVAKARGVAYSDPQLEAKDAASKAAAAELETHKKVIDDLQKKLIEREARETLEQKRESIRRLGATESEIEAVEKMMTESGHYFDSYPEALEYYRYKHKPLTPSGGETGFSQRFPGVEDPREVILRDPEMMKPRSRKLKDYLDKEYQKAFAEATALTGGKLIKI